MIYFVQTGHTAMAQFLFFSISILSACSSLITGISIFESQSTQQEIAAQCFEYYTPQLENAANLWSEGYTACIEKSQNDNETFMSQVKDDENTILQNSNEVISYISNCQTLEDDLEFLNCFGNLSQQILSTIYTISNTALVDAALLGHQMNDNEANMYICTNETENAYVQQVAQINIALNECLKFGTLSTEGSVIQETDIIEVSEDTTVNTEDNPTTEETDSTMLGHTTLAIMSV